MPVVGNVLLADQRAVLVNLGLVVLVVVVGIIVGPRRGMPRGLYVTGGQLVLTGLAVVAIGILLVAVPAAVNRQPAKLPLASETQSLFHNEAKAESAQDRLDLASEVEKLIPQHVLIGWGYGVEFQFYEAGTRTVETIPYAHNIVLDLWLRLGLIGLVLFALAFGDSIKGGVRVWRRNPDRVDGLLCTGPPGPRDWAPRHGAARAPARRISVRHTVRRMSRVAACLRHIHERTASTAEGALGDRRVEVCHRRSPMTASGLGRLVGWEHRKRRSTGRGRARGQHHFSPDRRGERLLTAAAVEFRAEGPE